MVPVRKVEVRMRNCELRIMKDEPIVGCVAPQTHQVVCSAGRCAKKATHPTDPSYFDIRTSNFVLSAFVNPVDPLGNVLQPLAASAGQFGRSPALKSNLIQSLHHCGPVAVAFPQVDVEACTQPLFVALLAAEFLDVQFDNALA